MAYNDTLAEKQDLKFNDFIIANIFKSREKEWEKLSQNVKKNEKSLDSSGQFKFYSEFSISL